MPSFKTDSSFLEKISIGAIGTQKVFENLKLQGLQPIELERGSMNFKIWKKIKIKRIRVPDILCLDTGVRIESRAKTKLEITMSHSTLNHERGWDFGLNDNDYVALVICTKFDEGPVDWQAQDNIQYIKVVDLRNAFNQEKVFLEKPKGSQEGFETRITWPTAKASSKGIIYKILDKKIQYKRQKDNRTITIQLHKKSINLNPIVAENEMVFQNQIIASVVNVYTNLPQLPKVDRNYYLNLLSSSSISERYAAAKALSFFASDENIRSLLDKIHDDPEHIYIRLEAASSLAKLGIEDGWNFIEACLTDKYLANRLEAVIILAEINIDRSVNLLCQVIQDASQDSEIRAGAAWSLGELANKKALDTLISSFNNVPEELKIEAARALYKLSFKHSNDILEKFRTSDDNLKPGIAWALGKSGNFNFDELINSLGNEESRIWISYILGNQNSEDYLSEIEKLRLKDKEVYFAVTVLWKILSSWINNLELY